MYLGSSNPTKRCASCELELPTELFTGSKGRKDGLNPYCRTCTRAKNKARYVQNRDAERIRKHKYYEQNTEKIRERNRKWHKANREKVRLKVDEYYQKNKEYMRTKHREWYLENIDAVQINILKRRARKQNNGVYTVLRRDIKRLYSSFCVYCGSFDNIEIDHVLPISRGGVHSIGNLASACLRCNRSKGNKTVMEWKVQQKRKLELTALC